MNPSNEQDLKKSQTTTLNLILESYGGFLKNFKIRNTQVIYSQSLVCEVIKRYWLDVDRIKYHHNIKNINCFKIAGYLTYWIIKIKPFFPIGIISKEDKGKYCNEFIAFMLAQSRINSENAQYNIPFSGKRDILYSLRYRASNPDFLSIIYQEMATSRRK